LHPDHTRKCRHLAQTRSRISNTFCLPTFLPSFGYVRFMSTQPTNKPAFTMRQYINRNHLKYAAGSGNASRRVQAQHDRVRVRRIDHRCKVNSDEFDEVRERPEESFSSGLASAWPVRPIRSRGGLGCTTATRSEGHTQAKDYLAGLQPLTDRFSSELHSHADYKACTTPP
jgi:hypothetical protein